ncbi:hypothetical protein HDU67_002002, partial [Dinochytrium kinnereticum]
MNAYVKHERKDIILHIEATDNIQIGYGNYASQDAKCESSDEELEDYYKSKGMRSMDVQTDSIIIDDIPQEMIEHEKPHVMQICSRVSGIYIGDALLDGGANCNVIRLSLLYELMRQGREVYFVPFKTGRYSTGIGGRQPILGKCTLSVSPGSATPNLKKWFEFFVVKECPKPIILGMPVILGFYMDILAGKSILRYYYSHPNLGVKCYETPLKVTECGPTYKKPYTQTTIMCTMDRLPDISQPTYIAEPMYDDINVAAERTVYSHEELFKDGMRYHADDESPKGLRRKVVDMQPFPINVTHHGSEGRWLKKGAPVAHFDDNHAASLDFIIPFTEQIGDDVNLVLFLVTEVMANPHLKTLNDVHNYFCNVAEGKGTGRKVQGTKTSSRKNKKAPTNKIEVAINNVDVQHDEERDPMMDVPDDLPAVVMTTDDKLHDTVDNLPLVDGPPERLLSGDDLQL